MHICGNGTITERLYKKKWLSRLQKEVLLHSLYASVLEENGR